MFKNYLIFLFYLIQTITLSAQQNLPSNGEVFRDDVVPSVYINIPQSSLDKILDAANRNSDEHYEASFIFDNGTIRDTISRIGFRLRGNTSRKAAKKSFKVSFNEYEDQKFYGLEKMNLNGEHNDPSLSRSKLCFDFLNYLEVPASRANHVKLYINGTYYGLYLNVEHIDEEFTKSRYGNKGNLYKCTYGANLAYRGASASNYKQDYYELKKTRGEGDYEDLAKLIDVLNNTPDGQFECRLEEVFNVHSYLKSVVMEVLTGHWDGPNYNNNNFYLYFNTLTDKFEYIPYDLDNTLGVDFLGKEWSDRNIYYWSRGSNGRPLFDKIITREKYEKMYTYLMDKAISEYFNQDSLSPRVYDLKSIITPAALLDTVRSLDYGYTDSDFHNSFGYFSKS
ncbi:MAG: CotH kinase family protein, partial [Bacteroidia bacterium]